jgi:hypothetical protein
MATFTAHGDPIRIVPLDVPDTVRTPTVEAAAAAAAGPPHLPYRNGPLIAAAEAFTIFWGSAWQQAAQAALLARLNQFFDFILTSSLIDQLTSNPAFPQPTRRLRRLHRAAPCLRRADVHHFARAV